MDVWTIAVFGVSLLVLTVVPGIYLWWPSRRNRVSRSDLGVALMTGALIAFAVLALQVLVGVRLDRIEEQRRAQAERQNTQLTVGLRNDLTRAHLARRDLSRLSLYKKTLVEANLRDAVLVNAVLSGANLAGADLINTDMRGALLDGAFTVPAGSLPTELPTGWFDLARLQGADLTGARLIGASLVNARLDRALLGDARFDSAVLTGASLRGADLSGTNFSGADLSGADLAATDLSSATLSGAVLTRARYDSATVWPDDLRPRPRRCHTSTSDGKSPTPRDGPSDIMNEMFRFVSDSATTPPLRKPCLVR